ncbi:hypothetical protein GOBAR_AA31697 [Gossypium barbadense]|uniref:Uncharacterized protein n=1 Tax=Gossypium barbadense TaxID=3634 RepID=A0A2P5WD45_GOSBA|nr:hypothetical protein GOBAR_AA31697 [Gossypium barbadense]
MLSKFLSVSETCFQNTETALKNQQASIQGLETQIGQLSKLISEQPQGSLPSNIRPNPREHLNAISTQDNEGFIAAEPKLMQETVISKGELTIRVGNKTITLQARNSGITSNIEGNGLHQSTKIDNITLQKLSFKEVHEPCPSNDRGQIHEERRLWIEELDECVSTETRPSTGACLRPCKNRAKDFPNTGCHKMPQPCDMAVVELAKTPQACDTPVWKNHGRTCTMPSSRGKKIIVPASKKRKGPSSSAGPTAEIPVLRDYRADIPRAHNGTLLNIPSLDCNDKMSPQGISSMLSMRMIERRRGTYPPQYHLAQSTEEEAYEDISDDVPPQHEDPPTQPPPPSHPVHAAASYADIFECLARFEHQFF